MCKRYGALTVLRDVSLDVAPGEFLVLTGASGAGKTTLLRLIYGAERPDAGEVLVAGRNVAHLRRGSVPYLRRNLGLVFQDFKLLPDRSALDNVQVALAIRGVARRERWRRSMEALAAVGLGDRAPVAAGALSGGEQQRVALARALVGDPPLLLCDEPTGNLDPAAARTLLALLAARRAQGTTVLLATHDPHLLRAAACDRRLHLQQGALRDEPHLEAIGGGRA